MDVHGTMVHGGASSGAFTSTVKLRTEEGKLIEIDALEMPMGVKKVLHELDLDSTGIVDEKNLEEMEDGVALLTKLMSSGSCLRIPEVTSCQHLLTGGLRKEKSLNSQEMPYKHLPECIQEVMREWDADGSGMVGVSELSAAATAYKKVQQEGRMMRKIILGLSMVILLLMIGMFILSWAAAEMAKEMRGDGDAIMANSQGMVVKVASSDFEMAPDGTLIIRGDLSGKSDLPTTGELFEQAPSCKLRDASPLAGGSVKDNLGHALKDMTADAQMEGYVKDAGMEGLFEDPKPSGFGDILSWEFKLHLTGCKSTAKEGNFLTVPGVIVEDGKVYKTWTEELVKSASLTAYMSFGKSSLGHYAMHPFQRELRLKRSGEQVIQAKIEAKGKVGYRCLVETPQKATIAAAAENALPSLEFRGVVVENGTVLRHWRMDPLGDLERGGNLAHEMQIAMMEAGLIPNVVDYFDVDTDPKGISGVPAENTSTDDRMFDYFNVTKLDEVEMLERTNRSSTSANFKMPPEIYPWSEFPNSVAWTFDELKKRASAGKLHDDSLTLARTSKYWDAIFTLRENQAYCNAVERMQTDDTLLSRGCTSLGQVELDSHRFYDQLADAPKLSAQAPAYADGRRLLARRLGRRTPTADDGSYFVDSDVETYTSPWLGPSGSSARRLDDDDNPFWKYKDIEVEAGKAKLQFLVQYCNLWNPTATNWGACMTGSKTGRAGGGDIVKLEAYCSGKQILFPFPKVQLELGGLLVYDDTSAMGIATAALLQKKRQAEVNEEPPKEGFVRDAHGRTATFFLDQMRKAKTGGDAAPNEGPVRSVSGNRLEQRSCLSLQMVELAYLAAMHGMVINVDIYVTCWTLAVARELRTFIHVYPPTKHEWLNASRKMNGNQHVQLVEFYDEDEDVSGYEDNQYEFNSFNCVDFKVRYDHKDYRAKWTLTKEEDGSSIVSFGDALLYGGLTFSKEVEIIWDIGASWTTEIGAAGAYHQTHGIYLAEIYGKTIFEITPAQIYLLLKFNPEDPWDTKYKKWKMYVGVGYVLELDLAAGPNPLSAASLLRSLLPAPALEAGPVGLQSRIIGLQLSTSVSKVMDFASLVAAETGDQCLYYVVMKRPAGFLLCVPDGFITSEELEQGQQAAEAEVIGPSFSIQAAGFRLPP
ncbi:hypothetical protein AK812_SmicGene8752 [Symbiodinium microadriaticum]|uniref:EF-hand domain-containing protein n=1 Tax=Symbiodinium microadriaticum TaxID=2951 RepID=A0A1Q9EJY8_SYMMI|nr:hypothetical protein AK812_SmicGene8752 [Symbiodinium microadriaticum]